MNYLEENSKKKRDKRLKTTIFISVSCLLVALLCAVIFFLLPVLEEFYAAKTPPVTPFIGTDDISALYLDPETIFSNLKDEQQNHIAAEEFVSFCKENGVDTVFLLAKSREFVYFNDKVFSNVYKDFDPVSAISQAAQKSGIQTFVLVDLYSYDGTKIKKLSKVSYTQEGFDSRDEKYNKIILQSISNLCNNYPIGGIAFYNLADGDTDAAAVLTQNLGEVLRGRKIGLLDTAPLSVNELHRHIDFMLISDGGTLSAEVTQGLYQETSDYIKYPLAGGVDVDKYAFNLFFSANLKGYHGAILGDYKDISQNPGQLAFLSSAGQKQPGDILPTVELRRELEITYPASESLRTAVANCFVMGLSNPDLPLFVGDKEIIRTTVSGSFGVLLPLEIGENIFVFSNGDTQRAVTITRFTPTGGGGTAPVRDATVEAQEGDRISITTPIASALKNKNSDGSINGTFWQGGEARVLKSDTTVRSGKITYVYQLSSGDYVMAYNTKKIGNYETPVFSSIEVQPQQDGESIVLFGGTPIVYDNKTLNRLTLTMYDIEVTAELFGVFGRYFDSITAERDGAKTTLTIELSKENPVWGYTIQYEDGNMKLYLQAAPTRRTDTGLPLDGYRVVIDPGHGGTEFGAPGIAAGDSGPAEQGLNYNLSKIIALRLQQLGADVSMTRGEDENTTLEARLQYGYEQRPHFFLAVHHNSIELVKDGNDVTGVEGYYFNENSEGFATRLTQRVAEATKRDARGSFYNYFYVTRQTCAQSVLFEYGFVINPSEYDSLYSSLGIYSAAFATGEAFCDTVSDFYSKYI